MTRVGYGNFALVVWCIFSEIRVASPPAPRLPFLMNVVYERLPQQLLTSNPRLVLQYIISVLLQLNIDSSNDAINGRRRQHQLNRTLIRADLLDILNTSVHLTSLQLVHQMAFALYLITVSILSQSRSARYITCDFLLAVNNSC